MTSSQLDPGSISVRPQEPWTFPFYSSMNGLGFKILTSSGLWIHLVPMAMIMMALAFNTKAVVMMNAIQITAVPLDQDDDDYDGCGCDYWMLSMLGWKQGWEFCVKGFLSFEVLMTSGFSSFELDFFLSVAFCVTTARSWKVRLTESSGIPRYISSSSFLAFANVDKSPMLVFRWF